MIKPGNFHWKSLVLLEGFSRRHDVSKSLTCAFSEKNLSREWEGGSPSPGSTTHPSWYASVQSVCEWVSCQSYVSSHLTTTKQDFGREVRCRVGATVAHWAQTTVYVVKDWIVAYVLQQWYCSSWQHAAFGEMIVTCNWSFWKTLNSYSENVAKNERFVCFLLLVPSVRARNVTSKS